MDDERLLDALKYYVLDSEYHKLGEQLSDKTVTLFKLYSQRSEHDGRLVAKKRDEIAERPEGWDYSLVRAFSQMLAQMRAADYAEVFTSEQREELIAATVKVFSREDEDGYADPSPINLNRRADDPPFKTHEPFDCRNYDLFAALAGVRNGRGFAGVYTGEPIKPIAEPRGIPEDADPDTLKCLSNEHTPSWLTLKEILEYNWDQSKTSGGIVSAEFYEILKEIDPDNLYPWSDEAEKRAKDAGVEIGVSGDISGVGIRVFDAAAYEHWRDNDRFWISDDPYGHEVRHIIETGKAPEIRPYVRIQWTVPLRESISDDFWAGVEAMKKLIPEGGTEKDVRLVFDFDS